MTYCPPFPASHVTNWDERLLDCSVGEWGVDVGLTIPTAVLAPFDGAILDWYPCCQGCSSPCYCWGCTHQSGCGRLIVGGGPHGEAVGFGHIVPRVTGGSVWCGQPLGDIQQDACGGPHVEFMYFPSGYWLECSGAADPREYLGALLLLEGSRG